MQEVDEPVRQPGWKHLVRRTKELVIPSMYDDDAFS